MVYDFKNQHSPKLTENRLAANQVPKINHTGTQSITNGLPDSLCGFDTGSVRIQAGIKSP